MGEARGLCGMMKSGSSGVWASHVRVFFCNCTCHRVRMCTSFASVMTATEHDACK